ncbi:hypothetical protein HMPREF9440_00119 [Sutterella parvirubra YIT 11816]|uniref:Uncharacterized protein n=1 Tax=Sutterella parvirubra YIT 11816 TaxID=762967 RepID=H3KBM3_9BURK|nr:hypothetical protein HMPREF9440_00119 [Sutterella parvirubra YIT 11816]
MALTTPAGALRARPAFLLALFRQSVDFSRCSPVGTISQISGWLSALLVTTYRNCRNPCVPGEFDPSRSNS